LSAYIIRHGIGLDQTLFINAGQQLQKIGSRFYYFIIQRKLADN
jgi:hypothetical protein